MKRNEAIEEVLKPLAEAPNQVYLSNVIQVADILEWILSQMEGEATIWQTSFSISEEFLRRLFFIKRRKAVKEVVLILDHKATNKTLSLWTFITQVIQKAYLADNHSKILLVESTDGQKVAVITSQNLTRGNRHESTMISTEEKIYENLKRQVEDLIRNKSVPLQELYDVKVNEYGIHQ